MFTLLTPLIADMHREALLDEAEIERRGRLVQGARPTIPAWRRLVGRTAAGLGRAFTRAAGAADPTIGTRGAETSPRGGIASLAA